MKTTRNILVLSGLGSVALYGLTVAAILQRSVR